MLSNIGFKVEFYNAFFTKCQNLKEPLKEPFS